MRKVTLLLAVSIIIASVGFGQQAPAKSDSTVTDTLLPFQRQDLKEVKVVARKRLVEQKIDKMVVNVDAAVTNAGTTAMDVLEKSPGIQVDKDGNISLKGKQGVLVMIDGRPTYLNGPELANLLKGMESSQLEQIEIMTNPPARYDAAGNSGVINIKTKKNKLKGFNGNLSANVGQGKYSKMNESLSLNYRNNKVNLFGNFSHGRYNNFQELTINRRYKNEDETTRAIFEQVAFNRNTWNNHNAKLGLDYYLTNKTTLGIVASGFTNPSTDRGFNKSYLKNPQSVTDSIVESRSNTDQRWSGGTLNFNMRHSFDSAGKELTADLDYVLYDVTNNQNFSNISYTPTMVKQFEDRLRGDIPMQISIYSGKMDYTHPLKKDGKIELGWKSSYVENDSRANYYTVVGEEASYDYTKTNYFRYRENINAAYFNFNKKLSKKFEIQTGLRFENTNYSGLQWGNPTQTDSSFDRSYNGLFPTVYLKYSADSSNQFAISVGRRIERPRYEDLNPFMFFIDKYTYGRGNPYLLPQYSNNIEVSHTFKGFLTTTVNFSETKNMFAEIFDQEGSYATIVRSGNIGKRINMGIAMSAQIPVAKWMNSNVYANYNYDKLNGKLTGDDFEVQSGNLSVNINNQLTFGKGWSGEVSGWYRTKGIWGQIRSYPMGALNAGISKQVLKEKGSVKVAVRDLFYTQPPKGDINFKSTEAHFRSQWDSRQVNITFSYRFGKPFKSQGPGRRESRPEEQNRVKGGGN